jgi:hypothetical protein
VYVAFKIMWTSTIRKLTLLLLLVNLIDLLELWYRNDDVLSFGTDGVKISVLQLTVNRIDMIVLRTFSESKPSRARLFSSLYSLKVHNVVLFRLKL